jgi:hypothetical protein
MTRQIARQRKAILERDGRALRQVGIIGWAASPSSVIAPWSSAAAGRGRGCPICSNPRLAEHFQQRRIPAAIAGEQFIDAARAPPRIRRPIVGDVTGEDVVERAAADRIADHVAVRADPADIFVAADPDRWPARHAFDRHDAAPRHLLR